MHPFRSEPNRIVPINPRSAYKEEGEREGQCRSRMQKSGETSTSGGTDTEDQAIRRDKTRMTKTAGLSPMGQGLAWQIAVDVMVEKTYRNQMSAMEAEHRIRTLFGSIHPPEFVWARDDQGRLVKHSVPTLSIALLRLSAAAKLAEKKRTEFYEKNSDYGLQGDK